jgi:hypothetical protein
MMNEYTNDDHLIEQYLFGDLSGMALQNFEKRMAQDTNFAKHVAVEKSVFSGLEALGNQDLKAQLEQIHQEEIAVQPKAKIRRMSAPIRWAIAASLLIVAGFFIWNWQSAATPETLFVANYESLIFDVNRSSEATADGQKMAQLYQKKDYEAFLNQYPIYLQNNQGIAKDTLYLGIAAMELNQFGTAKIYFKTLVEQGKFQDDATWYLALLSLKEKDVEEARKWLKNILEENFVATPARKEKAKVLLEKL